MSAGQGAHGSAEVLRLKSLRTLACAVVILVAAASLVIAPVTDRDDDRTLVARTAGSETAPVAVIAPLPEVVSNGTEYLLDAFSSYDLANDYNDTADTIVDYVWEITVSDATVIIDDAYNRFTFDELGLYWIKLTVVDYWNNSDVAYSAVMCVEDADFDGMPDWWERHYFGTTDGNATDDSDSDGYTDLQEWALGTAPDEADWTEPEPGLLEENWAYIAAASLFFACVVALVVYQHARRRRKEREAKKIEYAIEIEKSLEDETCSEGEKKH